MAEPRGLGAEDAARHMGISSTLFRQRVAPEIRPAQIGTRKIWLREDLDAWLDRAVGRQANAATLPIADNPLDSVL